jgi:vacuolar-type H+-ATPase subunit F/Vma7
MANPKNRKEKAMIRFSINSVAVLMVKFFAVADKDSVLGTIVDGIKRVVFIDTPATSHLVATLESLISKGVEVIVRDHHDVPNPRNPREQEIAAAASRVRELVGANALISNRQVNPACSSLIEVGQFASEGTVIVADPDLDGLLGAMKAVGVVYDRLDSDADVLDGGRASQTAEKLSANALLLTRAMASLPPYDANRPQISEDAKAKLFTDFVAVVSGDVAAKTRLEKAVEAYEVGVKEAERLLGTVTDLMPGVTYVDVTTSPRFDLATLAGKMESKPGVKVTVQKKSQGPIAAKCGGVQYSLAVVKAEQANINLQSLLPTGFVSSPETGIISNTSFLLHVSETVWTEVVLPALKAKLAN